MDISANLPERINYKGHFGMESSFPSASTGHVALHEAQHIRQFEAKAAMEGKTIRNEQVRMNFEFRNGKLVATSGEASAQIVDEKNQNIIPEDSAQISDEGKNKISSEESDKNVEIQTFPKIIELPPDFKIINDKIKNRLNNLKNDLTSVQNPNQNQDKYSKEDYSKNDFKTGQEIDLLL